MIKYYKINCPSKSDPKIVGELSQFASHTNIGIVRAILHFQESYDAVYVSYSPSQISHPSVKEKSEAELLSVFEAKLNQSGLTWKEFNLEKLLRQI